MKVITPLEAFRDWKQLITLIAGKVVNTTVRVMLQHM